MEASVDPQPRKRYYSSEFKLLLDREIYGISSRAELFDAFYGSPAAIARLELTHTLKKHRGCVNTVTWSSDGRYLVSGSDDTRICLWDYHRNGELIMSWPSGHTANIFSTIFMPKTNNQVIVSCAGDSEVRAFRVSYEDGGRWERTHVFTQFQGRAKKIATFEDDPHNFLCCSEDGTVRLFDLRLGSENNGFEVVRLETNGHEIVEINSIDSWGNYFCIGAGDPIIRVYDIRQIPPDIRTAAKPQPLKPIAMFAPYHLVYNRPRQSYAYVYKGHVTGVAFHGDEIIGTYSGDDIFLFNLKTTKQFTPDLFRKGKKRSRSQRDISSSAPGEGASASDDFSLFSDDMDVDDENGESDASEAPRRRPRRPERPEEDSEDTIMRDIQEMEADAAAVERSHRLRETPDIGPATDTAEKDQNGKDKDETEAKENEAAETDDPNAYHVQRYSGHCNIRTVKSVNFFGRNAEFVISGSDDGKIFIWDKNTAQILNVFHGDRSVVNIVEGHPFDCILAASGIEYTVKIFAPVAVKPVDLSKLGDITTRNREMAEQRSSQPIIPLSALRALLRAAQVQVRSVRPQDDSSEATDPLAADLEQFDEILSAGDDGDDDDDDGGDLDDDDDFDFGAPIQCRTQ